MNDALLILCDLGLPLLGIVAGVAFFIMDRWEGKTPRCRNVWRCAFFLLPTIPLCVVAAVVGGIPNRIVLTRTIVAVAIATFIYGLEHLKLWRTRHLPPR